MTALSTDFETPELRLSPAFDLEVKAGPEGVFEGLASPFGGPPDAFGDIVEPGAFGNSLSEHKAAGTVPALLWAHDMSRPLGRWESMSEAADGLRVKGRLNLETAAGREAFAHIKAGDVTGLSIGYRVQKGGAKYSGNSRILTAVDLLEVSLVAVPAARSARVTGVKALHFKDRAHFRETLHGLGVPRAAAETLASHGWPGLEGKSLEDLEAATRAASENQTLAEIVAALRVTAAKL